MSYSFFVHFNRNNMQRGNPNVWTVHWKGKCYPAREVEINVPVTTRYVPNGRQPRATMRGKANRLHINRDGIIQLL